MKKTAKKGSSKKAVQDLDVKPAKGGAVRGGLNPQPLPPRKIPT